MEKKKGFFGKLFQGLTKTRNQLVSAVDSLFSGFSKFDDDFFEELEETLIMADFGVKTTDEIITKLKAAIKENKIKDGMEAKAKLEAIIADELNGVPNNYDFENKKSVILILGVNGVGKTTSIGKLAHLYASQGKSVVLAAADTFRAAAIDQLKEWGKRANVPVISQSENSDPAAVIYDAIQSVKTKNVDLLICDTAGRLHNKKNLMNELEKINRIISKEYPDAHKEVFLVLDGTTGQNGLAQAKQFNEIAELTGLILTKLDGTAKGGIVVAINNELKVPIKFIGLGEGIDDLQPFDAQSFVKALFEKKISTEE